MSLHIESDAVDNDKEVFLEEQFLLAELAIIDADIQDNDTLSQESVLTLLYSRR